MRLEIAAAQQADAQSGLPMKLGCQAAETTQVTDSSARTLTGSWRQKRGGARARTRVRLLVSCTASGAHGSKLRYARAAQARCSPGPADAAARGAPSLRYSGKRPRFGLLPPKTSNSGLNWLELWQIQEVVWGSSAGAEARPGLAQRRVPPSWWLVGPGRPCGRPRPLRHGAPQRAGAATAASARFDRRPGSRARRALQRGPPSRRRPHALGCVLRLGARAAAGTAHAARHCGMQPSPPEAFEHGSRLARLGAAARPLSGRPPAHAAARRWRAVAAVLGSLLPL